MSYRMLALVGCAVLACLTVSALAQPGDGKKDEKAVNQDGPVIKDVYKDHFLIGMAGDLPGNYSDEELGLVNSRTYFATPGVAMYPRMTRPAQRRDRAEKRERPEVPTHFDHLEVVQFAGAQHNHGGRPAWAHA
jgi:hypothetical protein